MADKIKFYQRWLSIGAIYGMAAGMALIALSLWPAALGFERILDALFWPGSGGLATAGVRQVTAVSGALTAGWSLNVWLLRPALCAGAPRVGAAILCGFLLWFVLDSAACLLIGGRWNLVGNVSFLVALLPPVAALMRSATRPTFPIA